MATPEPTPVEPKISRSSTGSRMACGSEPSAWAARRASSCRSWALFPARRLITCSGLISSTISIGRLLWGGIIGQAEPVSDAGLGDDMVRALRFDLDLLPQRADIDAQILDVGFSAPDFAQNEAMSQYLAGMRNKQTQDVVLARREFHLLSADGHDSPHEIDRQIAAAKDRLLALLLKPMALGGANSGKQLVDPEWLGDVVVGAEVERLDLRAFGLAARQNDDRQCFAGLPHLPDDIQSLHVGQAEIEDDDVRRFAADRFERAASVLGFGDDIALGRKARAQEA